MKKAKTVELLSTLLANFMNRDSGHLNELQDAIQDLGFTDRQVVDMTKTAVQIIKKRATRNG
jgi:hypothetical protein